MKLPHAHPAQTGVVLLEVLIAVLIFAFGILGIVGLQATSIKQVTDAKFRMEATLLSNQLIANMWTSDRTTTYLQTNFDSRNSNPVGYTDWKSTTAGKLPGINTYPPEVTVDNEGIVTVTIQWLAPNDPPGSAPHKHITIAQIK